jgi:hypothetical protein
VKYLDFIWALDTLCRYYPRHHTHELINLANDVLKWVNNELPEDSSTIIYLKNYFKSPTEAMRIVWKEIQLLAGPFMHLN